MSSQPCPSIISRTRSPLCAERLSITTTSPERRVGASICSRYASNTSPVVDPSTTSDGPIPQMLMLESSVTFFPRLRGAEQHARSPRLDHAYNGESEMFAPHSSLRTLSASPRSLRRPKPARRTLRTRRVLSLPSIFFSAPTHAPQHPAEGGVAHFHADYPLQELAPLGKGRRWSFFEVVLE